MKGKPMNPFFFSFTGLGMGVLTLVLILVFGGDPRFLWLAYAGAGVATVGAVIAIYQAIKSQRELNELLRK